ncbi:Glycosyltransferase family 9 (heptosyltransferase) [Fictibacillus solisalsi]|uniref:Glycosyltransferase family 9 (Heptosyltransferase) n=1 Tax=Fictibacillus solisalsi TaxID=459525 RepID=A0A1H0BSD1_9BACL|nr:glycosyltransferase family 9 protein [Fictibacillus solisalsi]SDN48473.1 Glycosyltransferase family 9 (heptosyltransferase) [Fictibacillus solisalsi]
MDLFKEKVKQNRQLLKQREKLFVFLFEQDNVNGVLSTVEAYTHSIVAFKGNQIAALSEMFPYAEVIYLNSNPSSQSIKSAFQNQGANETNHPIPYKNPLTLLVALQPNVDPFLVNDSILNRVHNSQNFLPYSLLHSQNYIYPFFIHKNPRFTYKYQPKKKRIALLFDWFFGNGDVAAVFKQIQHFVQTHHMNHRVDLITRSGPLHLLKELFPNCRVYVHFDSFHVYEAITKCNVYENVYFLNTRLDHPPHLHLIDVVSRSLGLPEPVSHLMEESDLPPLPEEIQFKIDAIKRHSKSVIGIQFHTKDSQRCWNPENISDFVVKCEQNSLTLVNLTPQKDLPQSVMDLSSLPLPQLFSLIKQLDIVVGIDSVCGHIAGVVGTPSLTIWGGGTPLSSGVNPYVSYRPVSGNYSVYTESGYAKEIPSTLIFKRMMQILKKEIPLGLERITIQQTQKKVGVEQVGDSR